MSTFDGFDPRDPDPANGFEKPNYTQIPNIFFDTLMADLGEKELKVLLYMMRRIFGFQKHGDAIAFSQFIDGITTRDGRVFDRGCGLNSRTSVSHALKRLEELGLILCDKRVDAKGRPLTTTYRLRFRQLSTPVQNLGEGSPKSGPASSPESGPTPVQNLDQQKKVDQNKDQKKGIQNARRAQSATGGWGKKGKRDLEGKYSHLVQR